MSDGFYTLYGKDFKVIRGTCFVVGALVSCRVENPYGFRFTQEATLSPEGSIDPQSFRLVPVRRSAERPPGTLPRSEARSDLYAG